MAMLKMELRRGRRGFWVWSGAIGLMLVICVLMFPEMKTEMSDVSDLFANMGSFTQAFGMDRLNFGTLIGFYGVECGNILGIGGGFFAAYLGISMLSREEQEHTAEFLLTHPVHRLTVLAQKLGALAAQILLMNVLITALSCGAVLAIGETVPVRELVLLHGAYLILQLEIGLVCFGISAWLRRGSVGIGLGLAAVLYFANILRNISPNASFLGYVTPFAYAEPAELLEKMALDGGLVALGSGYAIVAAALGIWHYLKKDIAS